ncbi:type II toxin-antitoxin system HigA family antitoxin [Aerosakkonemataceae cyanobacterium BLCC-F154]|uniref:Type II toxin-antitoxin system HigA family antitoxin n=1 Tax=Floridaenema fluviatile BLCC-F154 TaxID=3153640 RepID=A0ABV4YIH2_9CYAN
MASIINKELYAKLLAETLPRVIHTEDEHKRLVKVVEKLMDLGEELTDEQAELFDLLVTLIEQYEDKHYQLKTATPHEILNELMLVNPTREYKMFTVYLKNGETVQVALEDLKEYLDKNREQIQIQQKEMGKRRYDA